MASLTIERKQQNGRYKPDGKPITDNAFVYKSLATSLYRHSINSHANRIHAEKLDDYTMRFVVTYYGNTFRSVYIVDNIGW